MDIFENFVLNVEPEQKAHRISVGTVETDESLPVVSGRRSTVIHPGMKVNWLRVISKMVKHGRYGTYSDREYVVQCEAPNGASVCGKKARATYGQLYYGTVYSCGCTRRPKHPPIKLEGQRFGSVEVLRWTYEHGGAWECVCHECGELIYRRTSGQVKAAGNNCLTHNRPVL